MKELKSKELENINGGGWLSDIENIISTSSADAGPIIGGLWMCLNKEVK